MAKEVATTVNDIENKYINKHNGSKQIYDEAKNSFASGVTHDVRYVEPFPIYAERARGTKKWDVDGNEFVDYAMGHGSLLLGYGDDRIRASFREQVEEGIHMGSSTEMEIQWAKLIKSLVPCANNGLVRACSSGSEAVQTAIRLARIHTGNDKIILQAGSYHGKADPVIISHEGPPYGMRNVKGIPDGIKEDVEIVPFNNLNAVEEILREGNVAGVLLHSNNIYEEGYIEGLRDLTEKYDSLFIMDEVVSGFRYAAGGAQEYYGVEPDIAVLGKVIGGGAPIGAVCGSEEVMKYHKFKDDDYWNNYQRIAVGGTWNAQPISIIGGIAMMEIINDEKDKLYPKLHEIGNRLKNSFNEIAEDLNVSALANGLPPDNPTYIKLNLFNRPLASDDERLFQRGPSTFSDYEKKQSYVSEEASTPFYQSMANNGVYGLHENRALITCTKYSEEDLQKTENAFRASLEALKINDLIGTK